MPLAFTHLATAWLAGIAYQKYTKKVLSSSVMAALVAGGLFPDADFFFGWFTGIPVHRTFTHSLLSIIVFSTLFFFFSKTSFAERLFGEKLSSTHMMVALGIGILIHIVFDMFFAAGVQLFWPAQYWMTVYGQVNSEAHLNPMFSNTEANFDMIVGCAWLGILWVTKRLRF